jgi:hypothetical protein
MTVLWAETALLPEGFAEAGGISYNLSHGDG